MGIAEILGLFGGLALFLHGMQMMSAGLEAAAGDRMKGILERLTANRLLGVLVGAAITAAIQSSSATTVMVVGFVNAGMMTLNQAVWIIMGANVGTTVTGLLIALDVGVLAPIFAFVGVALMVFVKKRQAQNIGQILAGLGILFIGMDMMSASMSPLRESAAFVSLMANFSNPVLGILFGALFTAVIQSSSASVGILQTLAASGVIPFSSAVFVLFGQNIGTCITAMLASMGANRNAKRATLIHLLFNVIGTVLFTAVVLLFPLTGAIQGAVASPKAQIAVMHAVFNLATTLLLLPLGGWLAQLAVRILPEREDERDWQAMALAYLAPVPSNGKGGGLGLSAIVVEQLRHELHRMMEMARENVDVSFRAVLERDAGRLEEVERREEYLDFLNREISRYVSRLISVETNVKDSKVVSSFFTISGNIERIGDHADNLAGYTRLMVDKNIALSPAAQGEVEQMRAVSLDAVAALLDWRAGEPEWLADVAQLEQKIDDMTEQFRLGQLARMREGACSAEACILYSELLTDFERIGDHVLNIAEELTKAETTL